VCPVLNISHNLKDNLTILKDSCLYNILHFYIEHNLCLNQCTVMLLFDLIYFRKINKLIEKIYIGNLLFDWISLPWPLVKSIAKLISKMNRFLIWGIFVVLFTFVFIVSEIIGIEFRYVFAFHELTKIYKICSS
jgi:hypothetical protein